MNNDKNFNKILKILFGIEGGYNNDPDDRGGETNLGVTQDTFNAWRKMNNLPLASVKNDITKDEAKKIYYNMFWKEVGADKYQDPRDAMILFDTAVNSGPYEAKRLFKKSNENFYQMLDNRKKYYDSLSTQPQQGKFLEGWYNRLKTLENGANQMIKEGFYVPSYYSELTPFDDGYKGNLKPVGNIPNKEAKRNKYQYNRNWAKQRGYIKPLTENPNQMKFEDTATAKPGYNLADPGEPYFRRSLEDLAPWEIDKMLDRFI